jgi:hypothetical protein
MMTEKEKWQDNIVKAFKSYFSTKDDHGVALECSNILIKQIVTAEIVMDNSLLELGFSLNGHKYLTYIVFSDDSYIMGEIYYVWEKISEDTGIYCTQRQKVVSEYTDSFCEDELLLAAKSIEEKIWRDYWKRNGGGGNDPIVPDVPVGSFEKSPNLTLV